MKDYLSSVLIGCLVGFVVLGILYATKDRIGIFVWKEWKWDEVALTLNTSSAYLARAVGDHYFNVQGSGLHDLPKAKAAYEAALERNPEIDRVHYQLGRINFIEGNFYKALSEINKEIENNPDLPNSYYMLGLIYGFRDLPGDLEKAAEGFRKSVELIPGGWAGYNDLAWILIRQEKYDEAHAVIEDAFSKMEHLKDQNVWLWTALGVTHLNTGYYNEARDAFIKAEEIAENMTAEYFWSAYPGNDRRNADAAFTQFRSTLHFNLALTHEKLQEYTDARSYYQKYLEDIPQGPYPVRGDVEKKITELNELI